MQKLNLLQKLSLINDHWNPRIAGELNGQYVKLVKFQGPFTWHQHENEDELFMVIKGRFRMDYRDESNANQEVWIEEGEVIIVPRGVEHCPVAEEECQVLLFEPVSTLNTGNVQDEFTKPVLESI
jgi:mannose-6-phosphate isomerase-like protein (cupin superfamily)